MASIRGGVWGGLEDTSADVQVVKIPEKWYGLPLFDYFHGLFDYPQGSIPVNLQHCLGGGHKHVIRRKPSCFQRPRHQEISAHRALRRAQRGLRCGQSAKNCVFTPHFLSEISSVRVVYGVNRNLPIEISP